MKHFIKVVFINAVAIALTAQLLPGLKYNSLQTLIIAAGLLGILNALFKPVLKILLLPFNVITLGLFAWIINVITVYTALLFTTGITIEQFSQSLSGTTYHFSRLLAIIVISLVITLISRLVGWIIK